MENLELLRMTPAEFDTYYAQAVEIYAAELEKSGRFPDAGQAQEFARWEYGDIFPQGLQTPGTDVYHIYIGGQKTGVIWLLREEDTGFIGDFLIDGAYGVEPLPGRPGFGGGAVRFQVGIPLGGGLGTRGGRVPGVFGIMMGRRQAAA